MGIGRLEEGILVALYKPWTTRAMTPGTPRIPAPTMATFAKPFAPLNFNPVCF